jgi:hypothetical protein
MTILISCGPRVYSYRFSRDGSKSDDEPGYKDDTLSVTVGISPKGYQLHFHNKTKFAIGIKWQEIKVEENGIEKRMVYVTKEKGKEIVYRPHSFISSRSRLTEGLMVFEDNITYVDGSDEGILKIADVYPLKVNGNSKKVVQPLKGQKITFYIPVEISNVGYSITLDVFLLDITTFSRYSPFGGTGLDLVAPRSN